MQRQTTGIVAVVGLLLALAQGLAWGQAALGASGTNTIRPAPNDTTTGTTINLLAKPTSTGALKAATTDTDKPLYIVVGGAGISGYAFLNESGIAQCVMDTTAANVAGYLVTASTTTAGRCHVFGAPTAPPSTGYVIGEMHDNATTAGQLAQIATKIINYTPGSGAGTGTMTSYNVVVPAEWSASGCNVTTAGTCTITKATETANTVWAGPASGSAAVPTFRALVPADSPSTLRQSGTTVPTTLAGDVNDYAGCGSSGTCSLNGGAADRSISGITAGTQGDILTIVNGGTTNALKFPNQSASSSAANRVLMSDDTTTFPGETFTIRYETTGGINRWKAFSNAIPDKYKLRPCAEAVGDVSVDAPPLLDDQDSPAACSNRFGKDWKILTVVCRADAGAPTITPILTGGSATSILTGPCTCGTGAWAACAVNGAPLVHPFSGTGATCSTTPCDIAINITTAGGTAKFLRVEFQGILQ